MTKLVKSLNFFQVAFFNFFNKFHPACTRRKLGLFWQWDDVGCSSYAGSVWFENFTESVNCFANVWKIPHEFSLTEKLMVKFKPNFAHKLRKIQRFTTVTLCSRGGTLKPLGYYIYAYVNDLPWKWTILLSTLNIITTH